MITARYLYAIVCGTLVTLLLFWLMQALIADVPSRLPERQIDSTFTGALPRGKPPVPPVPTDRPRCLEELPVSPPRPRGRLDTADTAGTDIAIAIGPQPVPAPAGFRPDADNMAGRDAPLVSLVQVRPTYPAGQITHGIEGYVVVEFDVTEAGTVENVRIIESSDSGFERSAVKAAERFRFRPRVVNGEPVQTADVRKLFRYRMNDE